MKNVIVDGQIVAQAERIYRDKSELIGMNGNALSFKITEPENYDIKDESDSIVDLDITELELLKESHLDLWDLVLFGGDD